MIAKIRPQSFKNLLEILKPIWIFLDVVTVFTIIRCKINYILIWRLGKSCQQSFCLAWIKIFKRFRNWFCIVFYYLIFWKNTSYTSARFVRQAKWHSLSLFSKDSFFYFAMRFCPLHGTVLYISLSHELRTFKFFEEFFSYYKPFWNLTIKPFLRISFYSFIFGRCYFVNDISFWMKLE